MRASLTTLLLFLSIHLLAQAPKLVDVPLCTTDPDHPDTSLWFKTTRDLARNIGLADLRLSGDSFHFRFWTSRQALDIWTGDHKTYAASVTNFAERYDDRLLKKGVWKVVRIYFRQVRVDSAVARKLFDVLQKHDIVSMPSDDDIPGWGTGFDGVEYLVETATPTRYAFKAYWTPYIYADRLPEAKRLEAFVRYLYDVFKLDNYYDRLQLPAGTYKSSGFSGVEIRSSTNHSGAVRFTDLL